MKQLLTEQVYAVHSLALSAECVLVVVDGVATDRASHTMTAADAPMAAVMQ
jgi:hypothetical protein